MAYRDRYEADEDDDDPEYPDAADTDADDDDDEQDLLEPCPNCRHMIYSDSDRCPYCGQFVTPRTEAGGHAKWVLVVAGVCLVVVLYYLWTRGQF